MPGSLEEAAAGACAPSPSRLGRRGARAPLRARTLARSLARAGRRLPRLRSGSEPLRRVRAWSRADPSGRVLWAPGPRRPLPGSQPTRPSLSSRNGAGAARGRASWTRLALGLALSAAAWLAPPCAFPQSVAPEAPLSGGRGSCFRFFLSLQSGVASSTPAPLPLSRRGQLQLEAAVATGDGADRLAPASGKGALGSRAPRAADSRTGRARALRSLGSGRSFVLPPISGLLLQLLQPLLSQRPREKVGREPPGRPGVALAPWVRGAVASGIPGPVGWGRGGRCPSANLCTYRFLPPQPGPHGQTVGRWVPLLCCVGLLGLEIGVNLHKDAIWRVAEAGQLMAWVPRYPLLLICE